MNRVLIGIAAALFLMSGCGDDESDAAIGADAESTAVVPGTVEEFCNDNAAGDARFAEIDSPTLEQMNEMAAFIATVRYPEQLVADARVLIEWQENLVEQLDGLELDSAEAAGILATSTPPSAVATVQQFVDENC